MAGGGGLWHFLLRSVPGIQNKEWSVMMRPRQRWVFCNQRLLGTETEDKSDLYCANPCFLGASCDSSSRLPCTGVLGAGWQVAFPPSRAALCLMQGETRTCAVRGLGPRSVPGCHSAVLLQEDAGGCSLACRSGGSWFCG